MRRTLSFFIIALASLFLSAETEAQTQAPSCPAVKVEYQTSRPYLSAIDAGFCPGDIVTFTASVNAIISPLDKPTFNWTVSGGKIISGQGSSVMTVSTDGMELEAITATVEVGGVQALRAECGRQAAKTVGYANCCLSPCPAISISCPTDIKEPGAPLKVYANISGGGPDLNLKYKWQVLAGKILSGQGTPEITVETTEESSQRITATVEIGGLPPECDTTETCSVSFVFDSFLNARKFDEYGEISWISEEARLVNLGIQMKEEPPDTRAFIIIYGARGRVPRRLAGVRKFLIEKQGVDPNRIQLINGGYNKEPKVELWIVPTGAAAPTPNPNF